MTFWGFSIVSKRIGTWLFFIFSPSVYYIIRCPRGKKFHFQFITPRCSLLFSGVSLTCYSCYSHVNWTFCDEKQQKYICEPWLDVCAKSRASFDHMGLKFDVYERGCFKGDYCNTMACKFISQAEDCDMTCCDYDFCNDAALPTFSRILAGCLMLFTLFKHVLYR